MKKETVSDKQINKMKNSNPTPRGFSMYRLEIFPINLIIGNFENIPDLKNYLDFKDDIDAAYSDAVTFTSRNIVDNSFNVCILFENDNVDSSTVVHETAHATFCVMDFLGIPVSSECDEVFAYIQEYIHSKCESYLAG